MALPLISTISPARAGHRAKQPGRISVREDEPVLAEDRVELLWYLREQSVCHDYHRYGNGSRNAEPRKEPR